MQVRGWATAASVGMARRQCDVAVVRTWRLHLETPVSGGVGGQHGVPSVRKIMWRSTSTSGMKTRRTGDDSVGVHDHGREVEHCNKGRVSVVCVPEAARVRQAD